MFLLDITVIIACRFLEGKNLIYFNGRHQRNVSSVQSFLLNQVAPHTIIEMKYYKRQYFIKTMNLYYQTIIRTKIKNIVRTDSTVILR